MTARKGDDPRWRHTSVLIRDDIFSLAQKRGLNLSHECNQALADRLGLDYHQQQLPSETIAEPVIIAAEQKPGPAPHFPPQKEQILPPVLNADDPKTPAKVLLQKKEPAARIPHQKRDIEPAPKQDKPQDSAVPSRHPKASPHAPKKDNIKSTEKKGRENAVRRFVNEKVVRTDTGGAEGSVVSKDEMYQRFVRWCRAHSVSPVPDKRSFGVAMKNRFVVQDGTVNSEPCWINVKLA